MKQKKLTNEQLQEKHRKLLETYFNREIRNFEDLVNSITVHLARTIGKKRLDEVMITYDYMKNTMHVDIKCPTDNDNRQRLYNSLKKISAILKVSEYSLIKTHRGFSFNTDFVFKDWGALTDHIEEIKVFKILAEETTYKVSYATRASHGAP